MVFRQVIDNSLKCLDSMIDVGTTAVGITAAGALLIESGLCTVKCWQGASCPKYLEPISDKKIYALLVISAIYAIRVAYRLMSSNKPEIKLREHAKIVSIQEQAKVAPNGEYHQEIDRWCGIGLEPGSQSMEICRSILNQYRKNEAGVDRKNQAGVVSETTSWIQVLDRSILPKEGAAQVASATDAMPQDEYLKFRSIYFCCVDQAFFYALRDVQRGQELVNLLKTRQGFNDLREPLMKTALLAFMLEMHSQNICYTFKAAGGIPYALTLNEVPEGVRRFLAIPNIKSKLLAKEKELSNKNPQEHCFNDFPEFDQLYRSLIEQAHLKLPVALYLR